VDLTKFIDLTLTIEQRCVLGPRWRAAFPFPKQAVPISNERDAKMLVLALATDSDEGPIDTEIVSHLPGSNPKRRGGAQ
jgi:hypothetical protein